MIVATIQGVGRIARAVAYALIAVAGVLTFVAVFDVAEIVKPLWWVMSVWLVFGGLSSFAGQLVKRWTGEFVGLPLIGSSLFGFSLLQLNLYGWTLDMVPSTALLWAFALIVLSRWRDVYALYRAAPRRGVS